MMLENPWKHVLIAEIGSVHDGSYGNALKLIEAAARCGAKAVKFQTHIAEAETLPDAPAPSYFKAEPRMTYFKRTAFTLDEWHGLAHKAAESNVLFLSSPFSLEAVDLLEEVGVTAYKIPSGEVSNLPLLKRIAQTRKMVLLSSGMSNWAELDQAVERLKTGGPVVIMQCASAYPCPPERVGLNVIAEMRERYQIPVGYSDHTLGLAAPIAAAALGATVIEKHFTFSKLMYGSDAQHSMEPNEFLQLAKALEETWKILDHPIDKNDLRPFQEMKQVFEKSVVTKRPLRKGELIRLEDLAFKKPGDGIKAARAELLVGKVANRDLPENHKLSEEDFK